MAAATSFPVWDQLPHMRIDWLIFPVQREDIWPKQAAPCLCGVWRELYGRGGGVHCSVAALLGTDYRRREGISPKWEPEANLYKKGHEAVLRMVHLWPDTVPSKSLLSWCGSCSGLANWHRSTLCVLGPGTGQQTKQANKLPMLPICPRLSKSVCAP